MVRVRVHYVDSGSGEPQYVLEQTLQVQVAPAPSDDAKVQIVQPRSPYAPGEPDTRIAGNALTFVVKAAPAPAFSAAPLKIQYWNGAWTDVAYTMVSDRAPPFVVVKVDIESLITGGTFTAGTPYFFRAVVSAVASAVDADPTTNPDQDDRQGPVRLTPVTGPAAHIRQTSNSPTVSEVQGFSSAALGFQSNLDASIDLPFGGLGTASETLKIAGLAGNPTGTTSGLALTDFMEISIVGGGSLSKPLSVRIYYPDADNDGIVDGLGVDERTLNVYHFVGGNWVPLTDITLSPSENWVESTTTGLSFFAVGAPAVSTGPDEEGNFSCSARAGEARTPPSGSLLWTLLVLLGLAATGPIRRAIPVPSRLCACAAEAAVTASRSPVEKDGGDAFRPRGNHVKSMNA